MRNKVFTRAAPSAAALIMAASAVVYARQERRHPATGHGHGTHAERVNERGDGAMGFDHKKTTHRFLLYPDGGSIEVTANAASDGDSRDLIRKHLKHVARMFAAGDFEAPVLIHDRVPPGVPVLRRMKSQIKYDFEETESGARVRIRTANREALSAIHEFLRFQIEDHGTSDSTEVRPRGR